MYVSVTCFHRLATHLMLPLLIRMKREKTINHSRYAFLTIVTKLDFLCLQWAADFYNELNNHYHDAVCSLFWRETIDNTGAFRLSITGPTAVQTAPVVKQNSHTKQQIMSPVSLNAVEKHDRQMIKSEYRLGLHILKLQSHQDSLRVLNVPVVPPLPKYATRYLRGQRSVRKYRTRNATHKHDIVDGRLQNPTCGRTVSRNASTPPSQSYPGPRPNRTEKS